MAIGPQRPVKGGGSATDPRLDAFLAEMPVNELFYKNSQDQMEGSGFVVPSMKIPSVLMGTDSSSNFKPFTFSPLAQQIIASNSEQMIRGMLGIEIPENVSELANDAGYITLSQVPSQTPQVNTDWNSTGGVSQLLNKPTFAAVALSGSYTDLTNKPTIPSAQVASDWTSVNGVTQILNKPTSFTPSAHTHVIGDVNGLQGVLDTKASTASLSAYATTSSLSTALSEKYNNPAGTTTQYVRGDGSLATFPVIPSVNYPVTSVNSKTGAVVLSNTDVGAAATLHTHVISDITGLQTTLDNKASTSSLSGYVTNSALTTSLNGYATTTALTSGLSAKLNTPSGSITQYIRGDGTLAIFPAIPTVPTNVSAFTNDSGYLTNAVLAGYRKVETFLGTSDANGNFTITFANTYSSPPDIQPQIIGGTFNQQVRVVSVSTTGCVVQAAQRNVVTLLNIEVLLGATVNLVGASITVQVTPRS